MSTKACHICVDDLVLGGFVAKINSLKLKLNLLFFKAQVNEKNVSFFFETHMVDVRPKLMRLVVSFDEKDTTLAQQIFHNSHYQQILYKLILVLILFTLDRYLDLKHKGGPMIPL